MLLWESDRKCTFLRDTDLRRHIHNHGRNKGNKLKAHSNSWQLILINIAQKCEEKFSMARKESYNRTKVRLQEFHCNHCEQRIHRT